MPMYEFTCVKCHGDFEELVSSLAEQVECPTCKSTDVTRKVSAFAFKSGGKFVAASGGSCSGCSPGPGGCSSCHH
jgi:putative FmdB family regulatory protein